MINAPYEKEFVFHDGQRAKNLLELSVILERFEQQDFERFVNPNKNDFANWIEYVLLEKELAASLRSTIIFSNTKELIHIKLATENNNSASLDNAVRSQDSVQKKRSFFNILKSEKTTPIVEVKMPIEKLPEPEKHIIQMLPAPEKKKRWFDIKIKKVSTKKDSLIVEKNSQDSHQKISKEKEIAKEKETPKDFPKKDNSLRKWYEFRRNSKKDVDKDSVKSDLEHVDNGNLLWVIIYGALILLIIALIIYKFVLNN